MNIISLAAHEMRDLYRHALHEAYRAEMQGLSIYSWIADNAGSRELMRLSLDEVDQARDNLDRLDGIIATADAGLSRESAAAKPKPFDKSIFASRRFTSARVRDLAMAMSAHGMSSYRLVRYKALVDIAGKLDSDDRLDGLQTAMRAIKRGETRMIRFRERL